MYLRRLLIILKTGKYECNSVYYLPYFVYSKYNRIFERKYKWRSRFMQSNRKLNHYDKRSPYDIYTRDIDIDAPNPYNVYKLFVGQNKNSDYQQREHDYHWYRFDRYELTSSKKYIFTNIVLCIAMAVMIIHYTFLVMDGVAILEGGYQYIPLLISVAICTNKLTTKYKANKIAKDYYKYI